MKTTLIAAICLAALTTVAHADTKLGDLMLSDPFTRATLPNAPVAGGFVTITNMGDDNDRLIAAQSPAAAMTEIHEMKMQDDIMQMRELEDGLVIPAGESVTLEPGGYHLMFMQLTGPFVEGETVPVTLTFEDAGEVVIDLPVGAFNAAAAGGHGHGDGHDMKASE